MRAHTHTCRQSVQISIQMFVNKTKIKLYGKKKYMFITTISKNTSITTTMSFAFSRGKRRHYLCIFCFHSKPCASYNKYNMYVHVCLYYKYYASSYELHYSYMPNNRQKQLLKIRSK